ncbi:MAG TPA: hypothetical protein VGJ83_02760 [Gemmatimonadales bacterium]
MTVAISGCDKLRPVTDKVKLAWDKLRGRPTATQTPPPARPQPVPDTTAARRAAAAQAQAPPQGQRPRPPSMPQGARPVIEDTPFISDDTGTVSPGMTEREVYGVWGSPVAVRRAGEYTYLFFPNGCEYTCGTMDVVTLRNDAVVDAIVRWDGHRYSGESSSPPGKRPFPNPGGDTLRVRPPDPTSP